MTGGGTMKNRITDVVPSYVVIAHDASKRPIFLVEPSLFSPTKGSVEEVQPSPGTSQMTPMPSHDSGAKGALSAANDVMTVTRKRSMSDSSSGEKSNKRCEPFWNTTTRTRTSSVDSTSDADKSQASSHDQSHIAKSFTGVYFNNQEIHGTMHPLQTFQPKSVPSQTTNRPPPGRPLTAAPLLLNSQAPLGLPGPTGSIVPCKNRLDRVIPRSRNAVTNVQQETRCTSDFADKAAAATTASQDSIIIEAAFTLAELCMSRKCQPTKPSACRGQNSRTASLKPLPVLPPPPFCLLET